MIFVVLIFLLAFILMRIGYTLYVMNCCSDKPIYVQRSIKSLVVLGSGGHTGEMLKIIRALDVCRYSPRVYVVAATDTVSLRRLQDMEKEFKERAKGPDEEDQYVVEIVPRSREVGQSWLSSVFTTAWAFVFSMLIVFRHRPSLLLTNGPGTCVPICIAAFIMRVLCLGQIRIVFIESLCRVLSLSLSGKILYRVVDDFFVQWPQLKAKYPRSIYMGRLV